MRSKQSEFEHSYLTWLLEQSGREDVVGAFASALFDDFEHANQCGLIEKTLHSDALNNSSEIFLDYCLQKGYTAQQATLFL